MRIAILLFLIFYDIVYTDEVSDVEEEGSGRTVLADWIVGILMMIVSLACAIAYYIILSIIYRDPELMRMASYRFMFFLGVFDIIQCFPHFVTGIFNCFQTVGHPYLAKAMGVIATPCYVAYAVLIIFLSLNRLIQLTSSRLNSALYGGKKWMAWIGIAFGFCFAFMIALASPYATIRYIPEWYSWDYDTDYIYSKYVQRVEMYIEVGGIFVSAFFYLLIVIQLIKTRKRFKISSNFNAEIKVLIQASVITVYCTILNIFWHNYEALLPMNLWTYTALNFMWILNSGVYPLIYFIVNKALRKKIVVRNTMTAIGGTSMFVRNREKHGTRNTITTIA
ncbi:unnamed protein product [Caenorhabditis bovis]|uniref:Serpentine receptor class gamma n=1 Tax=Caenorhabditis bovis TaxID=2654633 RepID=A0A8S1FA57_9PELO|nr:unnamed protein product [Caenorhabditis bovis]